MKETQFTAGPWEVSGESIVADMVCIAVAEDDGGYQAHSEEREANAHLIAAAPELYAALVEVLATTQAADDDELYGLDEGFNAARQQSAFAQARAALSKATGVTE